MIQRCAGELAFGRFDSRPLQREPVRVLTEGPQQGEIGVEPVPVVDAVRRGLDGRATRCVLPLPPVVVGVAAFNLMRGRGATPEKTGRKVGRGCGFLRHRPTLYRAD